MTIITSLFLNKKRVSWIKRILRIKLQIKLDLVIKGRSQYLSCRLQMDRLSVYFSCAVFVISLLAVIYLSNSSVFLIYAQNHNTTQMLSSNATSIHDKFGITEIYPTKENGREWYLNMSNPYNDSLLSITFEPNITRQIDV